MHPRCCRIWTGVGSVITGWDQGLLGMKLREERKLVIPADEGYGKQVAPSPATQPSLLTRTCMRPLHSARCMRALRATRVLTHTNWAGGVRPQGFPAWGIPAGGTLEFTLEVLSIE